MIFLSCGKNENEQIEVGFGPFIKTMSQINANIDKTPILAAKLVIRRISR